MRALAPGFLRNGACHTIVPKCYFSITYEDFLEQVARRIEEDMLVLKYRAVG
jgi:hypothetical protein